MGVSVTKASASARTERGERRVGGGGGAGGGGAEAAERIDRSFPTGRRGANRELVWGGRSRGGGKGKAMPICQCANAKVVLHF